MSDPGDDDDREEPEAAEPDPDEPAGEGADEGEDETEATEDAAGEETEQTDAAEEDAGTDAGGEGEGDDGVDDDDDTGDDADDPTEGADEGDDEERGGGDTEWDGDAASGTGDDEEGGESEGGDEPEGSGRFLDYDELPARFRSEADEDAESEAGTDADEDEGSEDDWEPDYSGRQFDGTGRNPKEEPSLNAHPEDDDEDWNTDVDEARAAVTPEPVETTGEYAPDDEEQPLEEHVTEMVHRFLAVAVVIAGVGAIALLWSDDLINFLWYSFLGPGEPLCPGNECPQMFKPHLYHPLSLVLARLKISVLVGFIVGLPVAVYQTYLFMRPGLYPHERRYYLAAVPTSLVLAAVGVAFAYFLILPALFSYFVGYTTRAAEPALGLAETFNIMTIMIGFFALVFQIPLFVMLAIMMGVTTRRWLEDRRLYFWMGFGGVAFIFSPDPTGMAPLLVALTMIGLFEGTLTLLRWTGEDSPILAPAPLRARRPYAWAFAALVGYAASGAPLPGSYFEQLPPIVVRTLADLGWTAGTPLIVAGAIVLGFEVLRYLLGRLGAGLRTQLWVIRARWPVWILAALVGYLASPTPGLLQAARTTSLELPVVVAIALGIVVAYEGLIQVLVWYREE